MDFARCLIGKIRRSESSAKSYMVKSRCKELTIGDYIELVCNNNISVLIVSGEPDSEALEKAKFDIIVEYMELSSSNGSAPTSELELRMRSIAMYKAQINGIYLVIHTIGSHFNDSCEILKNLGVHIGGWNKDDLNPIFKRLEGEIKLRATKLDNEVKLYNKAISGKKQKAYTERDIFEEISTISEHLKITITLDTNLALYAAHRGNFVKQIKAHENAKRAVNTSKRDRRMG